MRSGGGRSGKPAAADAEGHRRGHHHRVRPRPSSRSCRRSPRWAATTRRRWPRRAAHPRADAPRRPRRHRGGLPAAGGVHAGRAAPGGGWEVLPRFEPKQRRDDVPGVRWRSDGAARPPSAPRRPTRCPVPPRCLGRAGVRLLSSRGARLTTELYVMGCEYIPLGLGGGRHPGGGRQPRAGVWRTSARRCSASSSPPRPGGTPAEAGRWAGRDGPRAAAGGGGAGGRHRDGGGRLSLFSQGQPPPRVLAGVQEDRRQPRPGRGFTVAPPKPAARRPPPAPRRPRPPRGFTLKGSSSANVPVEAGAGALAAPPSCWRWR